jgi:hypothetical protein
VTTFSPLFFPLLFSLFKHSSGKSIDDHDDDSEPDSDSEDFQPIVPGTVAFSPEHFDEDDDDDDDDKLLVDTNDVAFGSVNGDPGEKIEHNRTTSTATPSVAACVH